MPVFFAISRQKSLLFRICAKFDAIYGTFLAQDLPKYCQGECFHRMRPTITAVLKIRKSH